MFDARERRSAVEPPAEAEKLAGLEVGRGVRGLGAAVASSALVTGAADILKGGETVSRSEAVCSGEVDGSHFVCAKRYDLSLWEKLWFACLYE